MFADILRRQPDGSRRAAPVEVVRAPAAGKQRKMTPDIDALYARYSRLVWALAWQYGGAGAEPEDLVQEVWLLLCGKCTLLTSLPEEKQAGYLAAMVRNTACSLARKAHPTLPLEAAHTIGCHESERLNELLDRKCSVREFRKLWPSVPQ